MRWIGGIVAALLVLIGVGYFFREALLLQAVHFASERRNPVGPTQAVTWQGAPLGQLLPSRGAGQPNIVLIVADDLGWNDLTFNGGGVAGGTVPTPNIDSIAHQGASFLNGYAANGTCAPSRASLMSGRYSTRFGFEFTPTPPNMLNLIARLESDDSGPEAFYTPPDTSQESAVEYENMAMPASEVTLAETLQDAGYYTAHVGKWHLGRSSGAMPHEQGFDDSLLMHSGLYLPVNDPGVVNSRQDFDPIDRFLWAGMQYAASFNGSAAFEPAEYITDYYTDEAINIIEQNRHRPFFLYLAHWAPHTPLQATREDYDALSHIEDHRLRTYAAMIRGLDRGVGEVLDALEENGLSENTLVIFTSDNGGAGYVGLPDINDPYRGWKITFFEGGIHVPYFMRWPEVIAPGTEVEEPVHHFDIYATAADAAGAAMPEDRVMDGVSLLPVIANERTTPTHERLFWREGHYQVVRSDGWKFQRTGRSDHVWLFNLNEDPTEQNNIADIYPERVDAMVAMLEAHNAEQADPLWPALLEAPIRIDQTVDQPWDEDDEYIYWPN